MRSHPRLLSAILGLLVASTALADIPPNSLRVTRTDTHVELSWDAGTPPYGVYRADGPQDVTAEVNLLGGTAAPFWGDPVAPLGERLYFYQVADPPVTDPECELLADPPSVSPGGTSLLSWTSQGAASATLNGVPVNLADSLQVTPASSKTYTLEVTGAEPGSSPALCELTLLVNQPPCSPGQPCPVECGSGVIDAIVGEGLLDLDGPDMVHVLILPEGYTSADLDAGIFDDDVQDWIEEWEIIDPYSSFRDTFCIWKQPVPSAEHVEPEDPQRADTAFLVPITSDGRGIASNIPLDGPTSERVWELVKGSFPFQPTSFYPAGGRTHEMAKNLVVVVMVYDELWRRSGLSGRARRLEDPDNADHRISAAFAHNRPHEFSHAFSRLRDEYIEDCCGPMCGDVQPPLLSEDVTNVVCFPRCDDLPWAHLLEGSAINPSTAELVGAFGVADIGYHPELKCLLNGTHDNATYYGGNGLLRVYGRMCNFCREVTAFRLFERIHVLDDNATSWDLWKDDYRDAYFQRYPFRVPNTVPQENSSGTPIYEACEADDGLPPASHQDAHAPLSVDGCDIVDRP